MSQEKKKALFNQKKTKRICFCSLFSAIICVCTLISIPLPVGYFNLGDAASLLSAWILGPLLGSVAAAVGSSLADVFAGYAIYAPATALIKALMVLCSFAICKAFGKKVKKDSTDLLVHAISAIFGEAVMVFGYLLYESFALSYGAAAIASVAGNVMQGIAGVLISTLAYTFFKKRNVIDRING